MKVNIKKLQNGQTIELTLPNGLKKKVETNSKEYKSLYPNVTTKINEDTYYKNLPDVNITAKNWLSHPVRKAMNEAGKNMMTGIGAAALIGTGAAGLVSAPLAFIGGTAGGIAGDYLTNKATDIISKGKYKNWGEFAGDKTGIPAEIMAFTNPGAIVGGGFGSLLKHPAQRLLDTQRRNLAISEYITPFGYEGKGKEVKKFLTDYVLKGKDKPDISWMTTRSQYDPVRSELRGEAWRKYLNVSKESDKLYIKNSDGTFRYNPEVIPKENIEFQRQAFKNSGNGNASKEYLTEQLQSAKKGYVGNAGGVTSIIDDAGNFTIKDTWDLMPLQLHKWLPKKIQNIEVGKVVGAKPFTVVDDQIGKVSSNFKSEINWGKWNKEIPSNKPLMDEYLQIEKTAKQNGTWMKNPDGSAFKGTPEQFVQQNSGNFKKAFNQGHDITYRGDDVHYPELDYNPVFTGDKQVAGYYAPENGSFWGPQHPSLSKASVLDNTSGGMYELYYNPKRLNVRVDAKGQDYIGRLVDNRGIVHRSTDDIASSIAVGENDAIITNIYDGAPYKGTVRIINHNFGSNNFMKSARGNNGMFDMTNPNIYKGLIPAAGLYGLTQSKKQGGKLLSKGQQGGNIKSFWGIQNGKYTPEYTNAVNSIINNPVLYSKITSNLNVKTPEEFKQLAFDNKIGQVHKSIVDVQNSTTPLPKDIVRYKSQVGKTEIPSEQFINIHKQEFDQQLSNFNNDSISAYNNLTKILPNVQKIGKYNNLTSVENKTINPKNSYSFKAKLQEGGQLIPKGQNSLNTEVLPKIENF